MCLVVVILFLRSVLRRFGSDPVLAVSTFFVCGVVLFLVLVWGGVGS